MLEQPDDPCHQHHRQLSSLSSSPAFLKDDGIRHRKEIASSIHGIGINLLFTGLREGFLHPTEYHIIDNLLIGLNVLGLEVHSRHNQGMVVFNLRGINTTLRWFLNGIYTFSELVKDLVLQ